MVMPNLYGNIVNNVCAGLVGGPGLVAGANYGHVYAVFETVSATSSARATGFCALKLTCFLGHPFKVYDLLVSDRKSVV